MLPVNPAGSRLRLMVPAYLFRSDHILTADLSPSQMPAKVGQLHLQPCIVRDVNDHWEERMNWIESLQCAIDCMETHLTQNIRPAEIAAECGYSAGHLQKGFTLVTGYTFAEYMRKRRLYQAALELKASPDRRILDVAIKYGYDSPDAFVRAFRSFHGVLPSQAREPGVCITMFQPLQIHLRVQGGTAMNHTIQHIPSFELIGQVFHLSSQENSFAVIPRKWANFMSVCRTLVEENQPDSALKQAIWQNNIGEFGLCHETSDGLDYMIAGKYRGGPVPEGFELRTVPALTWAMFDCPGPVPEALQTVTSRIFTEWLPQNPDWLPDGDLSMEYYPMGDSSAPDYRSQVWIPVKNKQNCR